MNHTQSNPPSRSPGAITVTAFKWVPWFAKGNVRDHRVRWVLNEVGWPYRMRLLDSQDQKDPGYRAVQPFGQVPIMEEAGRAPLFESGAIVLDVAMRSGQLLPEDDQLRSQVICWVFAALNSIEPFFAQLAEIDFFTDDDDLRERRRPAVNAAIRQRLDQLATALGSHAYLVGECFTIADLMVSSVLKVLGHSDLLDPYPALCAYRDRCFARPAYQKAIADQCAEIDAHRPEDMKYAA